MIMSAQTSVLDLNPSITGNSSLQSRTLAIILMLAIASVFWIDSRYPALLKRYHAGAQVKAAGALTFGAVYQVDRSMPLATRVWRTTVNWLDANRIGMTFSFLFGPASRPLLSGLAYSPQIPFALSQHALRRRRRRSASRLLQLHCANRTRTLRFRHE